MSAGLDNLWNEVHRIVEHHVGGLALLRAAHVIDHDPQRHTVRVTLQPEGIDTDWIPIGAGAVGSGFGEFSPPVAGDQVLVAHVDGYPESGAVIGRVYHDQAPPLPVDPATGKPAPVPGGEWLRQHASGSRLRLGNDGRLTGHSGVEIDMGNLGAAVVRLVREEFMALYNAHTHNHGPVPDQQMVAATHLTTILKAN